MASTKSSSRIQIIVAVITVFGAIATAMISNWDKINPKSEHVIDASDDEKVAKTDQLASTYTDIEKKRVIQFKKISKDNYRVEEPGTPWPWKGEIKISGNEITGWAKFPKSKASMDIKGLINDDNSINVRYEFITKGDGSLANGRVDRHVWFPVD